MSFVCLEAEECRAFIKNGKLRFQARKIDESGETVEQVTITFPQEMAQYFAVVEDLDDELRLFDTKELNNRVSDYLKDQRS